MSAYELDFDADYAEVAYALMKTREELEAAENKLRRYDQGITAWEWELEKFPAAHCAVLTPKMAESMLRSITAYGETGRTADAIARALEELS